MIKEFLKNYRDKHLFKIRKQIYNLIDENSRIVDFGCGDGELLRILSSKISYGLGVDYNKKIIQIAKRNCEGIKNLEFKIADASENLEEKFDYSILMFVLHSLDYDSQRRVLENAMEISNRLIIVNYETPLLLKNKILVYTDEILAGHYRNFRDYLRRGGIENLIEKNSFEKFNTNKSYLKIWEIYN